MASMDLARELQPSHATASTVSGDMADVSKTYALAFSSSIDVKQMDRFVPLRPKTALPLNITPRTNRIARQFGLIDDRLFSFSGDEDSSPATQESNTFNLLRRSASRLFEKQPALRPLSVTENLTKRRQCVLTLDAPGIARDPYAYPISWSRKNLIGVVCGNDVYYQNLNTKVVSHLCKLHVQDSGMLQAIDWAGEGREDLLASGSTSGAVQIWDSAREDVLLRNIRTWRDDVHSPVKCLGWTGPVLAVGNDDGAVSLYDVREKAKEKRVSAHKSSVLCLKWSTDGTYLATSDSAGIVYVWDKRAGKELIDLGSPGPKMRNNACVKVCAVLHCSPGQQTH